MSDIEKVYLFIYLFAYLLIYVFFLILFSSEKLWWGGGGWGGGGGGEWEQKQNKYSCKENFTQKKTMSGHDQNRKQIPTSTFWQLFSRNLSDIHMKGIRQT